MSIPVIYAAAGDKSNSIAPITSSGRAFRPLGLAAALMRTATSPISFKNWVSIMLGDTAFTVSPVAAYSAATARIRPSCAYLITVYMVINFGGIARVTLERTKTIRAEGILLIFAANFFRRITADSTWTAMSRWK